MSERVSTLAKNPKKTGWGLFPKSQLPWIVYSDRNQNPTFYTANRNTRYKKLNQGDACFVLKERNDYLKLIKYDPSVLGTWYGPRRIKDRKKAVFYGWVPKTNLLLTSQCTTDSQTAQPKRYFTALQTRSVLTDPNQFLQGDSVRVSAHPEQFLPALHKLRLYDLLYLYKWSSSGNQVLVGRTPQLSPDNTNSTLLGWVPRSLVQGAVGRIFLEPDTLLKTDYSGKVYPVLANSLTSTVDSVHYWSANQHVPWSSAGEKFPVLGSCCGGDGHPIVRTGVLTTLFDRTDNAVLNVNGRPIAYRRWQDLQNRLSRFNIVYVVDAGAAMQPHWGELINTVQNVEPLLADSLHNLSARVGVVLYGDEATKPEVHMLPLTSNFTKALDYLNRTGRAFLARAQTSNQSPHQLVYRGLAAALDMLSANPDESNLVVLVGATGNDVDTTRQDKDLLIRLYRGFRRSESRLLIFQTHATTEAAYNDFVLQGEYWIKQAAREAGERKREKIVTAELLATEPEYDVSRGDQNVYQLAFPKRSIIPGWALFPRKGLSLPFSLLHTTTDSLIRQMRADNRQVLTALDQAFANIGNKRNKVNPFINRWLQAEQQEGVSKVPAELYPYEHYPFYLPVYTHLSIADSVPSAWKFVVLLSSEEYEDLGEQLDQLSADLIDVQHRPDRVRLKRMYQRIARNVGTSNFTWRSLSLGQLVSRLTGLPVVSPNLNGLLVDQIDDTELVSDAQLQQALYWLRERRDWYRRIPSFPNSQFVSNGQTYYWVKEDLVH